MTELWDELRRVDIFCIFKLQIPQAVRELRGCYANGALADTWLRCNRSPAKRCQPKSGSRARQKSFSTPCTRLQLVASASRRPEERLRVGETRRPRGCHCVLLFAGTCGVVLQAQLSAPSDASFTFAFDVDDAGVAPQHMSKPLHCVTDGRHHLQRTSCQKAQSPDKFAARISLQA